MKFRSWKPILALIPLLAACGDDGGGPTAPLVLASISVSVPSSTIKIGQTTLASATAKDADGNGIVVPGDSVVWASSDNSIVTVSTLGLVAGVTPGTATVTASARGKTSSPVSVTVSAAQLTVVTAPGGAVSGSNLTSQPVVEVRDVGSNTVITTATVNVTAALGAGSTGALSGTLTRQAVAGVATFNDLRVTGSAGNFTLTFTSTNVTPATSGTVALTVTPGANALTGTVALAGGAAVGGGTVDIYSGTTLSTSVPVAGNGTYVVPTLAAGTYGVRLQPPLTHSIGPSEPFQQSVNVTAAGGVVQNFVVQPAVYADDFQSYTTATLLHGCTNSLVAGDFFFGLNQSFNACSNTGGITMDNSGGNSTGPKAMKYVWPASPPAGGYSVYLGPRITPLAVSNQYWVRWTSKESAGFAHGGAGAQNSANEYKFFLIQLGACTNGCPQFGVYLENTGAGLGVDPTSVAIDFTDRVSTTPHVLYNLGSSWSGQYHTWVAGMTGLGTANCTFTLYMDGVQVSTTTGSFMPGQVVGGAGQLMFLNMGSNINNGPDLAQSRWFRELGIYTSRPSLRAIVP